MQAESTSRRRFRRAPEEKRALIMASARACFAKGSYAATTSAEIAARTGVSEGTIFHHFGSKLGLLQAVAEEYAQGMLRAFLGEATLAPDGLEAAFRRLKQFVDQEGLLSVGEGPRNREAADVVREAIRERTILEGTCLIEQWQTQGRSRDLDPARTAEVLFPIFEKQLLEAVTTGREWESQKWVEEAGLCLYSAISR